MDNSKLLLKVNDHIFHFHLYVCRLHVCTNVYVHYYSIYMHYSYTYISKLYACRISSYACSYIYSYICKCMFFIRLTFTVAPGCI